MHILKLRIAMIALNTMVIWFVGMELQEVER